MTTLVPDKRHPALDLEESERVDYLSVVASMAFADADADDRELERVRDMCKDLELSSESTEKVIAAATSSHDDSIDEALDRLTCSDLRYALLIDAIDIAYADDEVVESEAAELEALAERLGISHAQLVQLRRYVGARTDHDETDDGANEQVAKGVAAAGVPAAALGIATIVGAPVVAGIGAAAALGVGSYMSVRYLFKRRRKKSA
jgi:uncharacterized tellurite resistance protein B-like protein